MVIGAFYWYEYRPSKIRAECSDSALRNSMASLNESIFTIDGMNLKEKFYRDCLRYYGLEK